MQSPQAKRDEATSRTVSSTDKAIELGKSIQQFKDANISKEKSTPAQFRLQCAVLDWMCGLKTRRASFLYDIEKLNVYRIRRQVYSLSRTCKRGDVEKPTPFTVHAHGSSSLLWQLFMKSISGRYSVRGKKIYIISAQGQVNTARYTERHVTTKLFILKSKVHLNAGLPRLLKQSAS